MQHKVDPLLPAVDWLAWRGPACSYAVVSRSLKKLLVLLVSGCGARVSLQTRIHAFDNSSFAWNMIRCRRRRANSLLAPDVPENLLITASRLEGYTMYVGPLMKDPGRTWPVLHNVMALALWQHRAFSGAQVWTTSRSRT